MLHSSRPGWIEVITGVMFSGKSEELIRRVRRAVIARRQVQVFKSHLDDRYRGIHSVSTHDGLSVEAHAVDCAKQVMGLIEEATEVVAIDEAQFLDERIVPVCSSLAERGLRVKTHGFPARGSRDYGWHDGLLMFHPRDLRRSARWIHLFKMRWTPKRLPPGKNPSK